MTPPAKPNAETSLPMKDSREQRGAHEYQEKQWVQDDTVEMLHHFDAFLDRKLEQCRHDRVGEDEEESPVEAAATHHGKE